jgi:O-antigen ligase
VLLGEARSSTERLGRYGALFVLSAGLLLTFSRASIVALLGSAFLFVLGRPRGRLPRPTFKGTMRAFASVIGLILLAGTLYTLVPALFAFFSDHLFGLIASPEFEGRLSDPDSSEGGRIALAMQILDFVSRNPLTGTGYLGIWILPGALQGSAHNQFTDVLLRTGVPGLAMYLVLLVALLKQLYRRERSLFWGIIAVLMYGLLHETFKEPQGAFVLSFLLGWLAESTRMPRVARRPMGADTVPAPT